MSKDIKYKIELFSDWHCGSGLSAGADLDLLVIKDSNRLPFVPGKTIKGLLREAVEVLSELQPSNSEQNSELVTQVFGKEASSQGCAFFKNAELEENVKTVIIVEKLQEFLYRSISSTAINDDGVAEEHSLRKMEVTVPCILQGEILSVPDECEELLVKGLMMVKRLGQNRNRGLGRCKITIL